MRVDLAPGVAFPPHSHPGVTILRAGAWTSRRANRRPDRPQCAGKTRMLRTIMGLLQPYPERLNSPATGSPRFRPTATPKSVSDTCRRIGGWLRVSRRRRTSCCRPGPSTRTTRRRARAHLSDHTRSTALRDAKRCSFGRSAEAGGARPGADGRAQAPPAREPSRASPGAGAAPRRGHFGAAQIGVSVILSESSMTHADSLLDRVFTIDRGSVSVRSSTWTSAPGSASKSRNP